MNAQQQKPIQQSQSLRQLTTKAIEKSFVDHIFEKPTATERFIDNGFPPSAVSRPWDKGWNSPKIYFRPFKPQFGLKIRGSPSPPGPSPGSATDCHLNDFFTLPFSRTKVTKLINMFQYKNLREELFELISPTAITANSAWKRNKIWNTC